jgi:hypothetical protein
MAGQVRKNAEDGRERPRFLFDVAHPVVFWDAAKIAPRMPHRIRYLVVAGAHDRLCTADRLEAHDGSGQGVERTHGPDALCLLVGRILTALDEAPSENWGVLQPSVQGKKVRPRR